MIFLPEAWDDDLVCQYTCLGTIAMTFLAPFMIHELFPFLTETASGSHPCCVVSVTYDRPSYFHGGNTGSNPVGDANSIPYRRIVYSLFNKMIRNYGFSELY
jgi:hypothetical protein